MNDRYDNLDEYTRTAQNMMGDRPRLLALINQALLKAATCSEALKTAWNRLMILIRLVKAWLKGDYRETPWRSIVTAVAAIVYFVNPVDLIPDIIPVIGYLDDATVIALAITAMGEDFNAFTAWESDQAAYPGLHFDDMDHTEEQEGDTTAASWPARVQPNPFNMN